MENEKCTQENDELVFMKLCLWGRGFHMNSLDHDYPKHDKHSDKQRQRKRFQN